MRTISRWVTGVLAASAGLLVLGLMAGCSKAADPKTDVAGGLQPATVGNDADAKKTGDTTVPSGTSSSPANSSAPSAPSSPAVSTDPKSGAKVESGTQPKPKPAGSALTGSESSLVGKFSMQLKAELPPAKPGDPRAAQMAKTLEAMKKDAASTELRLNKDRTFHVTGKQPAEGTWQVEGSTVILTVTKVNGKTVEELRAAAVKAGVTGANQPLPPMKLEVSNGGKTLTISKNGSGGNGSVVFTKK